MKTPNDADEEANYVLVAYVIGGCALFVLIALAAPATYHFVQPADHYVSVDDVAVDLADSNGHPDPCTFELTTRYYARHDFIVTAETTLYAEDNGSLAEVQRWREVGHLPAGVHEITIDRSIDEPLKYGTYRFHITITFEVSRGFDKQLEAESDRFLVHHGTAPDAEPAEETPTGGDSTPTGQATITTPEPTPSPTPTPVAPGIDTVIVYPSASRCL